MIVGYNEYEIGSRPPLYLLPYPLPSLPSHPSRDGGMSGMSCHHIRGLPSRMARLGGMSVT
jgi:hypothetical protein